MMDGLVPEAGRFRSGNVDVFDGDALVHAGTPAAHVPEVMADIFGWLEKTSDVRRWQSALIMTLMITSLLVRNFFYS